MPKVIVHGGNVPTLRQIISALPEIIVDAFNGVLSPSESLKGVEDVDVLHARSSELDIWGNPHLCYSVEVQARFSPDRESHLDQIAERIKERLLNVVTGLYAQVELTLVPESFITIEPGDQPAHVTKT